MNPWQTKRHEALDAYHADDAYNALSLFQEALNLANNPVDQADINLWIASCMRRLGQLDQALETVNDVEEESFMLPPSTQRRLKHVRADIYLDMNRYKDAFNIYQDLLQQANSYDDLVYLDHRIHDAIYSFEYFQEHRTVANWKQTLQNKLAEVLAFFINPDDKS